MASGDTLAVFFPQNNEPPPTSFATLDVNTNTTDTPDSITTRLDFDAAADEFADFGGFMPRHYAATTGITVTLGWASNSTTGACVWTVAFKSVTDDADDLDDKTFAAANSATATTASVAGEVDYVAVTFTDGADMDSVAAGEYFRMRISRDADNGSDTLASDAELLFVEIQET